MAKRRMAGDKMGGKSKVNEAGNYTKPGMRKQIFNRIKAGSKGGKPGQWSARKAQMMAKEYKAKGGGYKDLMPKQRMATDVFVNGGLGKTGQAIYDHISSKSGKQSNITQLKPGDEMYGTGGGFVPFDSPQDVYVDPARGGAHVLAHELGHSQLPTELDRTYINNVLQYNSPLGVPSDVQLDTLDPQKVQLFVMPMKRRRCLLCLKKQTLKVLVVEPQKPLALIKKTNLFLLRQLNIQKALAGEELKR